MRQLTTDGREIVSETMCGYCTLDTAGQHEADCPCREDTVLAESDLWWYKGQLQAIDDEGAGSPVGTDTQTMGV